MTKQIIEIDDNTFVAVLGRDGKAEKIIIGNNVDDVFTDTRTKELDKKILFEDEVFKTYGTKTPEENH